MTFFADLRYTFRSFFKNPGFTIVAVLTLALGIGANSAIFSVVNGVVLKPLEYPAPERLMMISTQFPGLGFDKFWVSAPEYLEYKAWNRSFEDVAIYNTGQVSIRGGDRPIRADAANCTADLFNVLDVDALHGRVFTQEEDLPGGEPVLVLSYELWQRAFGGDTGLVGQSLEVDGVRRILVGIMPPEFDVDDNPIEVWLPLGIDPANPPNRAGHNYYMVGRLAEGVGLDQARAELDTLLERWPQEAGGRHSPNPESHRMIIESLHEEVVGETRPAVLMLLGAVGFVLLVACANVGNLLLARAESRQKEIAIRTAIGAGRSRLVRQFLTEAVTLAIMGGMVGLLLAFWGLRILLAANPGSIPRVHSIALDTNVLLFTLAVSVFTGILFGLAPLLHMTAHNLGNALKEGGQRATAGSARHRLRRLLVVSEIALAVVLVIGAGLLLRSFSAMQKVDPGFNPDGLITFELYLPPATYPEPSNVVGFYDQLTERLSSLPGIESATAMTGLPPRRRINANTMQFEGLEEDPDGPPHNIDYWQFVTDGYFETMEIPLVAGRFFSPQDQGDAPPVTIVNETTAKTYWPGQDPIGRRLKPPADEIPWFTVIGVVKDVKQGGLEEETGTECYFFHPQVGGSLRFAPRGMNIVVRSSLPSDDVAAMVRKEVWARDASLPLANMRTMEQVLSDSLNGPRFLTLLLGIFGLVALVLAAVGTYGVMSYSVAERTSEFGIRMAMGADTGSVLGVVLSHGLKLAAVGLALGLLLALGLTRVLSSVLFGILYDVSQTDRITFLGVPIVLLVVAGAACLIPAYRATRVAPVDALRHE